jgi:hypothetical protein
MQSFLLQRSETLRCRSTAAPQRARLQVGSRHFLFERRILQYFTLHALTSTVCSLYYCSDCSSDSTG